MSKNSLDKTTDNGDNFQSPKSKLLNTVTDVEDATGNKGEKIAPEYKDESPIVGGAMTTIKKMTQDKRVGRNASWDEAQEGKRILKKFPRPRDAYSDKFTPEKIEGIKHNHEVDLEALEALYLQIQSFTKKANRHANFLRTFRSMRAERQDEFRKARQQFDDKFRQLAIPNRINPLGIGPRKVLYVSGKDNDCPFRAVLESAHRKDGNWEEGWSNERVEREVVDARNLLVGLKLTTRNDFIGLADLAGRALIQYFRDKQLIRPDLGIRVIQFSNKTGYSYTNLNYSFGLSDTGETKIEIEQEKGKDYDKPYEILLNADQHHYLGIEYTEAPSWQDVADARSVANVYVVKWKNQRPDDSDFNYDQAQQLVNEDLQSMNPQEQQQYLADLRAITKQARDFIKRDPNQFQSELNTLINMVQENYGSGVELRRQPDEVERRGIAIDDLTHSTTELESLMSDALFYNSDNTPELLDKTVEISEKLILENLKLSRMIKDLPKPEGIS